MKASLCLMVLLFSGLIPTFAEISELSPDPVIQSLTERLGRDLSDLKPDLKMEIPDGYSGKSLVMRYKTRNYMIYPSDMTGHLGQDLVESEGPGDGGILMKIHVQKKGEVNQAVVPQTLKRPYWTTYLNVYPVEGENKQLFVSISFRNTTDKKLIARAKLCLEKLDGVNR